MNYFVFNGEPSSDYGVYIGGQGTYNAPQRDVKKYSIPGRNGDLMLDNGRFFNISVSYPVVIMREFSERAEAFNAWLKSQSGYVRLEDTYHPESYRLAHCTEGIVYDTYKQNRIGKTIVTFDCKPQRYLKSGDLVKEYTAAGAIKNPTRFDSLPIIVVYGSGNGTVTIGNETIAITGINEYITIDSENQDCYKGTLNENQKVTLGPSGFPKLHPGDNGISFSGGVTKVEVKGKWWTV